MEEDQTSMSNDDHVASIESIVPGERVFRDHDMRILLAWLSTVLLDMSIRTREPIRDSILTGAEWVHEVLSGHSDRVYEAFRMERHVFNNLCGLLKSRGWLKDSRYIRVDEQVAIFLCMICHKSSNRALCERFQHSGETISKYFAKVLKAILKLGQEIIVPPSFDNVPNEISMDPKHNRYFQGCVGAIDGTHVNATVPQQYQTRFRCRKGTTTQNVLCVCSFDMRFTFVYAGWEGSANDCRVLSAALEDPNLKFPRPPTGKYYVVDSGYGASPGFLPPFKGQRYHLPEFRQSGRPTTAREMFNYKHSSLRNIIERSFGALKNRFFILKHMPPFTIRKQAHIVIACCTIHNYIRDQDRMDRNFSIYGDPHYVSTSTEAATEDDDSDDVVTIEEGNEMARLRKKIANKMARDNNLPLIP